jgi:hypothetical protein
MTLPEGLQHRLSVASLTVTSTYYAEVWSDMDTWLKRHCNGTFHLVNPCECWFEHSDELDAWYHAWHRCAPVVRRTTN